MNPRLLVVVVLAIASLGTGCSAEAVGRQYWSSSSSSSSSSSPPPIGPVLTRTATTPGRGGTTPVESSDANPDRGLPSADAAALSEARVVCAFDWRQSLQARVAAARKFATPAYAQLISPSSVGSANWVGTQADRESGVCTAMTAALLRDAPNTATVRFIRVNAVQAVTVGGKPAGRQPFSVVYRTEQQANGGWLVGGLSGGD